MDITNWNFEITPSKYRCVKCRGYLSKMVSPETSIVAYQCRGLVMRDNIWGQLAPEHCGYTLAVIPGGETGGPPRLAA